MLKRVIRFKSYLKVTGTVNEENKRTNRLSESVGDEAVCDGWDRGGIYSL